MHNNNPKQKKEMIRPDRHEDFLQVQNHCALCGSELSIKVESYLEDFYLLERAECLVCQIKTREKNHRMH